MTNLFISKITFDKTANIDYSAYPFSLPILQNFDSLNLKSNVTFFVGENGTGKSTLLEAIATNYGFNPEGGSKNFNFSTMSTHSQLHEHIKLSRGVKRAKDGYFLRAESFYNVASEIERMDEEPAVAPPIKSAYGGTSLHEQSHGESFFTLISKRFFGNGLYLLDEPEAALSPVRQMAMLSKIDSLVKSQSQFIIATHSPIILAYPNAQIFVFDDNGIKLTQYKETEHYIVTKQFLNNPEGMLKHLL